MERGEPAPVSAVEMTPYWHTTHNATMATFFIIYFLGRELVGSEGTKTRVPGYATTKLATLLAWGKAEDCEGRHDDQQTTAHNCLSSSA